ncbi:hypothetical protein ACWCQ0_53805, partial [Streptomyces massasporeus]
AAATALLIVALASGRHPAKGHAPRGLGHATASGIASGVASALTQTLTAAFALELPGGKPTWWQTALLAVLISGFATGGLLLSQAAYRGGLAAPLAVVNLSNPAAAAIIGVALLGETFRAGAWGWLVAAGASLVAARGVVLLTKGGSPEAAPAARPEAATGAGAGTAAVGAGAGTAAVGAGAGTAAVATVAAPEPVAAAMPETVAVAMPEPVAVARTVPKPAAGAMTVPGSAAVAMTGPETVAVPASAPETAPVPALFPVPVPALEPVALPDPATPSRPAAPSGPGNADSTRTRTPARWTILRSVPTPRSKTDNLAVRRSTRPDPATPATGTTRLDLPDPATPGAEPAHAPAAG